MNGEISISSSRRFTAFTLDLPPGAPAVPVSRPRAPIRAAS
jgi:hypothetical protein